MSGIAFDTLSGAVLGNYRLLQLIEYSQAGSIYLTRTGAGAETYVLRFLADARYVKKQWQKDIS